MATIAFQDACVLVILFLWTVLHFVLKRTVNSSRDKKPGDKKERAQVQRETESASSPGHALCTTPRVVNLRTQDRSVSPIIVTPIFATGWCNDSLLSSRPQHAATPKSSYEKCLQPAGSESHDVNNAADLGTSADIFGYISHNFYNQNLTSDQDLLRSELYTEDNTAESDQQKESSCCKRETGENENVELGLEGQQELDMDASRRRRLLEKTSDVSAVEPSSWRSRVYQKENTNSSNSSSYQYKETRTSYRAKETLSSIDNNTHDVDTPRESRRMSEDSSSSDLSDRLARRRAKRLEEHRDSVSQDESVDSCRDRDRRWSRDGSIRSLDSTGSGELDDRLGSRRSKRQDDDVSSSTTLDPWRGSRRNSRDSFMSAESVDNHEELFEISCKTRQRRRDSDGSDRGDPNVTPSEFMGRKWSSKDSSFLSADSTSSLRWREDESSNNTLRSRRSSRDHNSSENEPSDYKAGRSRKMYQDLSEDSVFSLSKEKSEEAVNSNNNHDTTLLPDVGTVSSGTLQKHRVVDSVYLSPEINEPATEVLRTPVNGSTELLVKKSNVSAAINGAEHVQSTSRGRSHVSSSTSVSLDVPTSTSNKGDASHEENRCVRGDELADVSYLTKAFQTPLQGIPGVLSEDMEAVETRNESVNTTNVIPGTNEELQSSLNDGDTESSSTSSALSRDSKASRRRRSRKDKSSVRKSPLNIAVESTDEDKQVEDNAHLGQEPSQTEEKPRRKLLTATRQKFMQTATPTAETSSTAVPKQKADTDENGALKKIARGRTDFNQLLQKFSGSESNSEKSDTDASSTTVSGIPRRRSLVKRQEAKEVISSSEESDLRRTPERTQSLKLPPRREDATPLRTSESSGFSTKILPETSVAIEKSSSFRSEFMNQKFAHRSVDTPQTQKEFSPLRSVDTPQTQKGSLRSVDTPQTQKESLPLRSVDTPQTQKGSSSLQSVHTPLTQKESLPLRSVDTLQTQKGSLRSVDTPQTQKESSPLRSVDTPQTQKGSSSLQSVHTSQTQKESLPLRSVDTPQTQKGSSSLGNVDTPQTQKELSPFRSVDTTQTRKESSPLQSAGSTSAVVKTHLESKTETVTSSASSSKEDNEPRGKGSGLLSRVSDVQSQPQIPSSLQNKHQDLKSLTKLDNEPAVQPEKKLITQADTSIATVVKKLPDKAKSPITDTTVTVKHNETVITDKSSPRQVTSTISSETKHPEHAVRDTNTPSACSTLTDSGQHREHPLAKPRSSLERDGQPATPLSTTSTSSIDSVPKVLSASVSSTLPSTVPSSEIKSINAPSASPDLASSSASEVRRASSFKEATVTRTDSIERRKGILKRNTSLTKHDSSETVGSSSFPVIDPQLAKILMQRKQMVGDASDIDEEEEKKDELPDLVRRAKPLSAAEEIEETLRYSQQKAAQRGLNPDEDEGLKRISVAERIYSMQTKIEEEKFAAVTPKSRSGLSTPRSRPRSGLITPTSHKSFDETLQQTSLSSSVTTTIDAAASVSSSNTVAQERDQQQQQGSDHTAVSGSQLMEKLTKIANATEKYEQKRHRFQHRSRNDRRHQTLPVTYEEIQAADSLETVSAFRALVRKQTSINALEQITAETFNVTKQLLSVGGKKTEFPQHLTPPPKLSRRSRKLRHRTLPVTADELNAVPEHQLLVTDPDWIKFEGDKRDSKADSGILSGSDADSLYHAESLRSLTLEMDLSDNDPTRLSVTDMASIFRVLEEKTRAEKEKEKSASGAKRYINRKKRERSQTMPITDDEVKSASELGEGGGCGITVPVTMPQPEVVNRSRSSSITEDDYKEQLDDDLVKLSLTEKVKLFSQPREVEKQPAKLEAPVVRRRSRKVASRFNTQPVTNEEVEKAAAFSRISPLAMSMVKPPDTEILKGLPLKDQRELMAQHAEMFLSQTSLRARSGSNASQSQPSSRRPSVTLEEGATKKTEEEEGSRKNDKKGILKDKSASAKDLHDTKSILKTEPVKAKSESEVHSILKMDVKHVLDSSLVSTEPRGILKKTRSEDMGGAEYYEDIKGILKHVDSEDEEFPNKPRSRSNSQPLGILKIENFSVDHPLEIRSILKAPSQENVHESPVIKSALRRGSMESDPSAAATAVLKSALRTRNKNSVETEDSYANAALASDLKNTSHDHDLNSNNSHRHVGLAIPVTEQHIDHFSSSICATQASTALSVTKSSGSMESKTSFITSASTETTSTTSVSTLQPPEGYDDRSDQSALDDGESSSGEILEDTPRTTKLKRKSRFSDRATKSESQSQMRK